MVNRDVENNSGKCYVVSLGNKEPQLQEADRTPGKRDVPTVKTSLPASTPSLPPILTTLWL